MKRYATTIKAKLFEKGDEDGIEFPHYTPYVKSGSNSFSGNFGDYYLCENDTGDRWLQEKGQFEKSHKEVE